MKTSRTIVSAVAVIVSIFGLQSYAQQYLPTNVRITTETSDQANPAIAIDPSNSNHLEVTWDDRRNTNVLVPGFSFSTDGGNTWSGGAEITPPSGYSYGFNTSCAIDEFGNEYCTFTTRNDQQQSYPLRVYIDVSTNNGQSWIAHPVSPDANLQDKPYMAIDNSSGKIYVAWTDFDVTGGSRILVSSSTDHGQNWLQTPSVVMTLQDGISPGPGATSNPIILGIPPPQAYGPFFNDAVPVVDPNGIVYVVFLYVENNGQDHDPGLIEFAKSTDGGANFSVKSIANIPSVLWTESVGNSEAFYAYSLPTIAVDPLSGNICVAYAQYDGGDYNIYFVSSTDKGTSWSSPAYATQTHTGLHFAPWLTANSSGIFSLVYYQGNSSSLDAYVAQSYDDGKSFWTPDVKVTSNTLNPNIGQLGTEYNGIASMPGGNVFPTWSDSRNSNSDENIYGALYNSTTSLAYNNLSLSSGATSCNNNRILAQGINFYEVFNSGGEIFVRQSNNGGTSWNATARLTSGNGGASQPSIAVYPQTSNTDTVNVVWQQNNPPGSSTYDIYYSISCNSGSTWSSPVKIASSVTVSTDQFVGPQPVIAGIAYWNSGGGTAGPMLPPPAHKRRILVVFTSSTGLKYTTCNLPNYTQWSTPGAISSSYASSVWYPSLAGDNPISTNVAYLTYDARYYHKIYSNYYDANTSSWHSEVVVYDGSANATYDRYSCIAVDEANNNLYAAWDSYNWSSSLYTIRFRQGSSNNTWGSWQWSYTDNVNNLFYPSITSYYSTVTGNYKLALTEYATPGNLIYLHKADIASQTWTGNYTQATHGLCSQVPEETLVGSYASPTVFWTAASSSPPYQISSSSSHLPKSSYENTYHMTVYERALSSGNVRIEFGNITAKTADGKSLQVPLKDFDYMETPDFSSPWQYLASEDSIPISSIATVQFDLGIYFSVPGSDSVGIDKLATGAAYTPAQLDVYSGNELVLTKALKDSGPSIYQRINLNLPSGILLSLRPIVRFSSGAEDADPPNFTTIENMLACTSTEPIQPPVRGTVPATYILDQNYPNPFNPTTVISYKLPISEHAALKVYDILGREIVTLVDRDQSAGSYNVSFNGARYASGVYFYRLTALGKSLTRTMVLMK